MKQYFFLNEFDIVLFGSFLNTGLYIWDSGLQAGSNKSGYSDAAALVKQFVFILFFIVSYFIFYIYDVKILFFNNLIYYVKNINILAIILFLLVILIFLFFIRFNNSKKNYKIYSIISNNNSNKNSIIHSISLLYNFINKNSKNAYFILSPKTGFILCIENGSSAKYFEQLARTLEPDIIVKERKQVDQCLGFSMNQSNNTLLGHEYLLEAFVNSVNGAKKGIYTNVLYEYTDPGTVNGHSNNPNQVITLGYQLQGEHQSAVDDELLPIKIPLEYMKVHTGIFGITGSGKTTTASWLAYQLQKTGNIVIVIDWHGEYNELIKGLFGVEPNYIDASKGELPLNPLGFDNIHFSLNIIEDVFDLTLPQSVSLLRLLKNNKIRSIQELIAYLEGNIEETGYWEKEIRYALLRRLEYIDTEEGMKLFSGDSLLHHAFFPVGISVVDVSKVTSDHLKKMYVLTFLRSIQETLTKSNHRGNIHSRKVFIIIDEAHNVLPKKDSNFISNMLAESRKFNLFLTIVTQSPSSINQEFLKNLGNKIIHTIRYPNDLKIVEELFLKEPELISLIPFLKPGEFVASLYHIPAPILGKIVIGK